MRVLCIGNMYPPHHLGGYELVWHGSVRALRAAGHEVRVLTTDFRLDGAGEDEDSDVHRDLQWYWRDHQFPRLRRHARARLERRNAATLARNLDAFAPDVVAWWSMGGMSLSLISQIARAGLPAAAFVHDDWPVYGPKVDQWLRAHARRYDGAARAEERAGVPTRIDWRRVDRWVFVSDATRRRVLKAVGELPETEVAPSGIDPAFVDPAPVHEWGWRLLVAGRLDPRKGLDTVIDCLPTLPPGATLVLAGGGDADYERGLRARIEQLRLSSRVDLLGGVGRERLMALLGEVDALVFPVTWEEPWGLVPLEAMGRGLPVVATGRGGSGEYLRDGENCLLFEAGDVGALGIVLERMAGSEGLRERLREGGIATAERHTAPVFEARVVAVLEEVVAAHGAAEHDRG